MRAEADAIAGDLAELSRVRKDIVSERATLSQNLDRLANEQLRLNMLIDERQKKQATPNRRWRPNSSMPSIWRTRSTTSKT